MKIIFEFEFLVSNFLNETKTIKFAQNVNKSHIYG